MDYLNSYNSFWDHVEELRRTLIRVGCAILLGTLTAFCFHRQLFAILLVPLNMETFYLFGPLEGFTLALKIAFWGGVTLSSPLWLYFLLRFFLPALGRQEKKLILPFLVLSLICALGGACFAYTITLPCVSSYFLQFNTGLGENLWSLKESVHLALGLILAHALVFELYAILLFLIHFGLISHGFLKKGRKGMIVGIFILAAILTPPDALSQLLLAFPMLLLFESALFFARFKAKRKWLKSGFN